MTRMLNLANILEQVQYRLDPTTLSQQFSFVSDHQHVLHVALDACNHLETSLQEIAEQFGREIRFVTKEPSPQGLGHVIQDNGIIIGHVGLTEAKANNVPVLVDDQVELGAVDVLAGG